VFCGSFISYIASGAGLAGSGVGKLSGMIVIGRFFDGALVMEAFARVA